MEKNKKKNKINKIAYVIMFSILVFFIIVTNFIVTFFSTSTKTTIIGAIDEDYLADGEVDGGFLSDYNLTKMVKIEGSEEEGYYFTFPEEDVKEILDITLFEEDVRYRDWGLTNIDTLMEFIETEIFTGLPNISKDPENTKTEGDKIQGAVKFKRQSFNKEIGDYYEEVEDDEITEADTSQHIIVIDAGHGNPDGGQVSNNYDDIATSEEELNNGKVKYTKGNSGEDSEGNEYQEWELNQKVVDLIIEKLSSDQTMKVIQTGKDMPDYQRLQKAIDVGAEAYISVHFNASNTSRGTEIWASASEYTENGEKVQLGDNSESIELGNILMDSISGQMKMGVTTSKVREYYKEIKSTLKTSEECGIPNVYVFGNNMSEDVLDELMKDDEKGLDDYAQGIVNGLYEYFDTIANVGEEGEVNASINDRYLTYTSPENFDKMINEGNKEVLEHFTLDEDMKMIVATWTYSEGQGAIFKKAAANEYTTKIKSYIMPYQYPQAFLQDTGAEEFSRKLARLSLDSDLIMTVFDNVTVNSDKVITTVTTESTPHNWTTELSGEEGSGAQIIEDNYGTTTSTSAEPDVVTTTTETSSVTLELTHADAWCVEYEKYYKDEYKGSNFLPVGEPQITESPTSFSETISSTETTDTGSTLTHYEYIMYKTITKVENQHRTVTYKFIENPNREPVLSGNTSKFVTLLREYTSTALTNIESDRGQGLIDLLASRAATANMVELTKWLLQETSKAIYFGLVKYEFDEFDPANFTSVSNSSSGGLTIFQEFLHSWENDVIWKYTKGEISYSSYVAKYITEDKSQYISFTDGGGRINFSYGIYYYNQNSGNYNNVELFKNAGVSDLSQYAYIGAKLDVEIVDEVERQYIQNSLNYIKETTEAAGISLNEHEIQGLLPLCYQWGNNIITESFIDAYKQYGNTEELRQNFEHHGDYPFLSGDTTSGYEQEVRRGNANWKLFHEGIYTTSDGQILDPNNYSTTTAGTGKIIDEAVALHKYLRENKYYYAMAGITVPNNTVGGSIDCSSYVTWVLINCGVSGFTEGMYQWTSSTFTSNPQGWQEVSVSEAQPGDIITYDGHVEIIAAVDSSDRFIVYSCGSDGQIQSSSYNGLAEAVLSGHSKGQALKILRVPNL